jgi:hypothetical protein
MYAREFHYVLSGVYKGFQPIKEQENQTKGC